MSEDRDNQIQLPLMGKGGNEKVKFIPTTLVSSPSDTPNNGQYVNGSQKNLCNGVYSVPGLSGQLKKVPNTGDTNKKTMGALTHLPQRPPVDIEFSQLSYFVNEGRNKGYKTILKDIHGQFRSGELTAIMGPSGAGKSTLMNILAGYKISNLKGSVLINGKERNLRRFRKLSCYIMQDDCLSPHVTVAEAMFVSANLKLGKDMTMAKKKIVIDEILETLGLTEAANTRSLKLSGGQRKRLSIALELVNNPPVMFFDEPTSGLDSSSCFQCIRLLKSLSRGGRTIICTIHQPSARLFEMFDHLYTMADGQCIYRGPVLSLVPFLSSIGLNCPPYHNPADFILEVATGEHGKDWVTKLIAKANSDAYEKSIKDSEHDPNSLTTKYEPYSSKINNKGEKQDFTVIDMTRAEGNTSGEQLKGFMNALAPASCTASLLDSSESVTKEPLKAGFPTTSWKQFWIILKRTFLSIWRDQTLTHLRFVSHAVVGILIGLLYYNIGKDGGKVMNSAGSIFFTVLFTMFTAMMPTILTFPIEMGVFVREHLNYWYSLKSFYFAKTIADLPFQIAFSGIYVLIVYYMTGQPMETDRILMFTSINVMNALVAQSLGLLIGAGMRIETGVYLGPVTSIPVVLFSGFFINFDSIPVYMRWLTYVSYVRYGFEGSILAVYGYNRPKLACYETFCYYRHPQKLLETLSMENASFWVDLGALTFMFVALRIIAYFVLRFKLRLMR